LTFTLTTDIIIVSQREVILNLGLFWIRQA